MDRQKQLETGLVLVLGLLGLYWLKRREGWLIAALAVGLVFLLVPAAAKWIDLGWRRLSVLLGEVTGKVLLTLVYVVVLLPLSLAARWTGRLGIRRRDEGSSNFIEVNHTYDKEDLKNPW